VKDPPQVPRYQQPDPDLRRLSDDELFDRRARHTADSWERHHIDNELLRRETQSTGKRAWVAIVISVLALLIAAGSLLHDFLGRAP
jgi:hypothetical protein